MWYSTEKQKDKPKEIVKPKSVWLDTAGHSDKSKKDGKEIRIRTGISY